MPSTREAAQSAARRFRSAARLVLLSAAATGLAPTQAPERGLVHETPPPQRPAAGLFALEVPELSLTAEADTSTPLPRGDVTRLVLRVRRSPSQVDYGAILVRVNTESANIVMSARGTEREVLCDLDLTRRAGFELHPGRNSIEIEAVDRSRRRLYASFLLDVGQAGTSPPALWGSGPAETVKGTRYAVVVGVSRYAHADRGVPNLRYADQDATAMRDFLVSPRGAAFPRENVVFLINEDATSSNVRSALFTFLTRPGPDDLVVLYFAGHGAPDPHDPRHLYLITHDTRVDDMGGTAFPMWHLQDVLGRIIKARRVLALTDACHSQGVSGAMYGVPGPAINLTNQYLARYAQDAQHALLTASGISEASMEDERWGGGHGVFTHFALKGLEGRADANRDGTVTAGELFRYVRDAVRRETSGRQTPSAVAGLAAGLALARVNRAAAALAGDVTLFRRAVNGAGPVPWRSGEREADW